MIKDLAKIREYLTDYVEVEMPYEFPKNCPIHYITCSMDTEGNVLGDCFYPNHKFIRRCNDILIVEHNLSEKSVHICRRGKLGDIIYQSRFFIPDNIDDNIDDNKPQMGGSSNKESHDKISYQQNIIERLIERVREVEIQKNELNETISTYEGLLQEGRFKLKELSYELRRSTEKVEHYEELIPKLYNSR